MAGKLSRLDSEKFALYSGPIPISKTNYGSMLEVAQQRRSDDATFVLGLTIVVSMDQNSFKRSI